MNFIKKIDPVLLGVTLALTFIGFVVIGGADAIHSNSFDDSFIKKQFVSFIISIFLYFFTLNIREDWWFDNSKLLYYIAIGLLSILIIPGILGISLPFIPNINGATRWIKLPLIGSIQLLDFSRIIIIVFIAKIIYEWNETYSKYDKKSEFEILLEIVKWILIPFILIFLQPNTSGIVAIIIAIFWMIYISDFKQKYIWFLIFWFLIVFFGFIFIMLTFPEFVKSFLGDYRVERIQGWLMPFKYTDFSFQLRTSIINFGSGGITGLGYQKSIVDLPISESDFIFSVLGSEWGFLGTIVLFSLYFILLKKIINIIQETKNKELKFIVAGFFGILFYQIFWNISMVVGLLPITGIPLPFISYGGSSLMSLYIMISIINVAGKHK